MNVCIVSACRASATNALYLGYDWPDGRRRYTLTCPDHINQVVEYQATLEVTAVVFKLDDVTIVGQCCAAWRSHACDLPDDHEDIHVCMPGDCDDSPTEQDRVFRAFTGGECSKTGGVPRQV